MKKVLYLIAISSLLIACQQEPKTEKATTPTATVNKGFNDLLEQYYEDGLQLNPLNATFAGDNRYNDQFPNVLSDQYKARMTNYYKNNLRRLSTIKNEELNAEEQLSKAVLEWDARVNLEGMQFRKDLLPIDQMWSLNLMIGQLASGASAQPFKTVADYNNWLSRLDGYVQWMDSAEAKMREGMKSGYVLPKSLAKKVIPQFEVLAKDEVESHLFYGPVKNFPDSFSKTQQDQLANKYAQVLREKVIPAYQSLSTFLKKEYLAAGRESSGIEGIPNGKAYYQHQIKQYTTTNMKAEEIHQLGLQEVARISTEMEKIKEQVGFEGDLKSFFDHVRTSKELMPFTEPQQVIDNFYTIYDRMKPQLEKLFDLKPKAAFEVRRTEAFREKSASAEYNPGSLDGTRPGIFYAPIPEVTKYNTYSDESLFLHEAIPGHHYQISLTQESKTLPQFRKTLWNSAYGEGWALYTESLGKELGLYTDPYQHFGMLGAEMHRAVRLVVDTGLHSKGWTREQAIQYSLDNEAESEASIISEIERYMANPGQALSYKIGQLKIRELRNKAEKTLGDRFDIRHFHNQILETGCIPLALLEDKIERWIANQ